MTSVEKIFIRDNEFLDEELFQNRCSKSSIYIYRTFFLHVNAYLINTSIFSKYTKLHIELNQVISIHMTCVC